MLGAKKELSEGKQSRPGDTMSFKDAGWQAQPAHTWRLPRTVRYRDLGVVGTIWGTVARTSSGTVGLSNKEMHLRKRAQRTSCQALDVAERASYPHCRLSCNESAKMALPKTGLNSFSTHGASDDDGGVWLHPFAGGVKEHKWRVC
jgi:hypothetical protein